MINMIEPAFEGWLIKIQEKEDISLFWIYSTLIFVQGGNKVMFLQLKPLGTFSQQKYGHEGDQLKIFWSFTCNFIIWHTEMKIAAYIALIPYGTYNWIVGRFYYFFRYEYLIKAIVRQFYSVRTCYSKLYVAEWKK